MICGAIRMGRVLCVGCLVLCGVAMAAFREGSSVVSTVNWYPERPKQGEVLHIVVDTVGEEIQVRAAFLGRDISFFREGSGSNEWHGIGGVDYSQAPGSYELLVWARDHEGMEERNPFQVTVDGKDFAEEHLTLPDEKVVLSPMNQRRVQREQRGISALFATTSRLRLWQGAFVMPVDGELGSGFGLRRIINEAPRSPHSGQDIKAAAYTPVVSSNRGKVALVGAFFFGGNSVFIDHGQGLYTMYFHLSRVNVREGDVVRRGDTVGLVGSTGRALGPHLHWGARISGARVDPLLLVKATASLAE